MQETKNTPPADPTVNPAATEYVAPRIESVMKPEDLSREVQYAGAPDSPIIIA